MGLKANRSMPSAVVVPVIDYPDVRAAVDWLCAAFGFAERLRVGEHRSQLAVGDGAVIVTGPCAAIDPNANKTHSVMVRVEDVDAHFERARAHGAAVFGRPETYPYGERQYVAADLAGHRWTFSQTVADADPAAWGGALVDAD